MELVPLAQRAGQALDSLRGLLAERATQQVHDGLGFAKKMETLLAAAALVLVATGALTAWRIAASVVQPLQRARDVTSRIATGDLSHGVPADSARDEAAELMQSLARMQDELRTLVGHVHSGVDSVSTTSSEIAQGNADLSQRTEVQAGSLQQTA